MNVLIIGLGSIAKKHIVALQEIVPESNIFALRSKPDSSKLKGVTNIYNLNDNSVHFSFAIISNPSSLHFKFIQDLAQRNIHLFIEKPPVHTLDNIDHLLKVVKEANILSYVGCNLRFHPCIEFLKENLGKEAKRINEVNVYCGSYLPDWRPHQDFKQSYSTMRHLGGGVHLDLFHELDYVTWIFGFPNYHHSTKKSNSSLNIDSIDYANYLLEYDHFCVNLTLNYYRRTPKRTIEILFDNDLWIIDLLNHKIINQKGELIFINDNVNTISTYISQMRFFIHHLNSLNKMMNSLEESVRTLELCLK